MFDPVSSLLEAWNMLALASFRLAAQAGQAGLFAQPYKLLVWLPSFRRDLLLAFMPLYSAI